MCAMRKAKFEDRFISGAERRQRVLLLMPAKGYASLNELAAEVGMTWTSLNKAIKSENVTAKSLCRIAAALDVKVSFLLER